MILHVYNLITKKEDQYPLRTVDDFFELSERFPSTKRVAMRSQNLEQAAENVAEWLSGYSRLHAWVSGGIHKSEEVTPEVTPEVKLKIYDTEGFAHKIEMWQERRAEESRKGNRDSTYTPDPGRAREEGLDEDRPLTTEEKIRQSIKETRRS